MPKHEILHKAGESVSDELKYIIQKYFSQKDIEKLERLGGRVLISVAAPYKLKSKGKILIDERFVEKLKSSQSDSTALKDTLDQLSVKQLKELCEILKQPLRSNAVAEEIKRELIRNLQSEEYWQRISSESTYRDRDTHR